MFVICRLSLYYNICAVFISNHHETLYPMTLNEKNQGGTNLLTKDQMESGNYDKSKISAPPVDTVTTLEILKWINTKQIIMKIDIEGFECKVIYNVIFLFLLH